MCVHDLYLDCSPPFHLTESLLLSSSLASSLRPIDVEFMKRLHHCVNVVPVIAKADTLTVEERDTFKQRVHSIALYMYVLHIVRLWSVE